MRDGGRAVWGREGEREREREREEREGERERERREREGGERERGVERKIEREFKGGRQLSLIH